MPGGPKAGFSRPEAAIHLAHLLGFEDWGVGAELPTRAFFSW